MAAPDNPEDRSDDNSVLYCPACAGEYPLTFEICPAHGLRLTKKKMRVNRIPQQIEPSNQTLAGVAVAETSETIARDEEHLPGEPAIEEGVLFSKAESSYEVEEENLIAKETIPINEQFRFGATSELFGYELDDEEASEGGELQERPGFRIAAIAITAGLAIFALIVLYTIFSWAMRSPSSLPAEKPVSEQSLIQQTPFIPTPEAARDYVDEETETAQPEGNSQTTAKPSRDAAPPKSAETPKPGPVVQTPRNQTPAVTQPAQPPPVVRRQTVDVSAPVPSQATDGRVFARLVRSRGRKTPTGYLYDLTFNILERAGRSMRWDHLVVSSRSASGASHNQTVPFRHYLGASGMLTFTVSVEMQGQTENDWRGRIVCTGFGMDTEGQSLKASFGATVAPW